MQGSPRNTREPSAQPPSRLSNIYLGFLDGVWSKRCADLGVLVRYCDDFVVLCKTEKDCREAERRVRKLLGELKLELHPKKTRRVDLWWGKQGVDFLGCHLRKRFSGPIWEKSRKRMFFLQRRPIDEEYDALGLHKLMGTVRYPEAA